MARISEVIHVKGTDGVVQECALFDSSSDIPSGNPTGVYSKELALNGSKIYAAMITEETFRLEQSDDLWWMYDNLRAPVHLWWDGDGYAHSLLTTPYFVRPLVDSIEVGADGGQFYLTDIVSSNGSIANYGFSDSFLSRAADGSGFSVAANTTTSARTFTVAITFRFADGSTQTVQLTGTQEGATALYITVSPDTVSFDSSGGTAYFDVQSNGVWTIQSIPSGMTLEYLDPDSGSWEDVGSGSVISGSVEMRVTVQSGSHSGQIVFALRDGSASATLTVTQTSASVSPSITLNSGSTADAVAGGYAEFAFTANSDTTSVRVSCSVWADGSNGAGVSYWRIGGNEAHSSDGEEAVTAGSSFTLRVFLGNTSLNDEIEVNVTPCNGSVTGTIRHCYINAS